MGGRGVYSFSFGGNQGSSKKLLLDNFAVGSLNRGISKGTNPKAAIERFRQQMNTQNVEFSGYVDSNGYIHALASSGSKGETGVVDYSNLVNEKNVFAVAHNHPSDKKRIMGGSFSSADIEFLHDVHRDSNGRINTMVATAKEGTYTAVIKKNRPSVIRIKKAMRNAESLTEETRVNSARKFWNNYSDNVISELGKIGITVSFEKQDNKKQKLVTQKIT